MIRQLHYYLDKLDRDGAVRGGRVAVLVRDEDLQAVGLSDFCAFGRELMQRLNATALVIGEPWLPVHQLIPAWLAPEIRRIVPPDTETRTFLHDIPLIRSTTGRIDPEEVVHQLQRRKGVLVEGVGIVAAGAVTVEQAYVNFSSVSHGLLIDFFLQLLHKPTLCAEMTDRNSLLDYLRTPIPEQVDDLSPGPFTDSAAGIEALKQVGLRTVDLHLVDSFFGNLSCRVGDGLLISQTGAALDALDDGIDPVPDDDSSTAGLTASSELKAHRAVYRATDARVILHGHPRFTVLLSLMCDEPDCPVEDCWKECPRVRYLDQVPVVAGEVGAGGLAETLPPVMAGGIGVVYGHGVFATGGSDFRDPLRRMIQLENWCRRECLRRFEDALVHGASGVGCEKQ